MVPAVIISGIPNGVFMYWLSANLFSLTQVLILKIPGVKAALGIPLLPTAPPAQPAESLAPRIPAVIYSSRPQQSLPRPGVAAADSTAAEASGSADAAKVGGSKGLRVKRRR